MIPGFARKWAAAGIAAWILTIAAPVPDAQSTAAARAADCDPALGGLFTPRHPQIGRYEVCTTPEAIDLVTGSAGLDGPRYGPIEAREALDAFGSAGRYDRSALARLYAGRRTRVAHGWTRAGGDLVSLTLISPYPDAGMTRLSAGTMIIRLTLPATDVARAPG